MYEHVDKFNADLNCLILLVRLLVLGGKVLIWMNSEMRS
jgi:hypothetical protein